MSKDATRPSMQFSLPLICFCLTFACKERLHFFKIMLSVWSDVSFICENFRHDILHCRLAHHQMLILLWPFWPDDSLGILAWDLRPYGVALVPDLVGVHGKTESGSV